MLGGGGVFFIVTSSLTEELSVAQAKSESLTVYTTVNSDSAGNNNSNFLRDAAETSTAAILKTDARRRADKIPPDVATAINVAVMSPPTIAGSLSASVAARVSECSPHLRRLFSPRVQCRVANSDLLRVSVLPADGRLEQNKKKV